MRRGPRQQHQGEDPLKPCNVVVRRDGDRTAVQALDPNTEQGLIVPDRGANGYREYDDRYVDRVNQIRGLLDAGLPTRIIKQILPCLDKPRSIHFPDATPEMLALLAAERDRLTERIDVLIRNRDAMSEYLAEVGQCRAPAPGSSHGTPNSPSGVSATS